MARTIIIGDIHGCFGELQELLDRVGPVAGDTILSVGDLVDRGPDPRGVVDLFRRPAADGVERRAICGNHERKHIRGVLSHSQQIARLQLGQVRPDRAFDEGRYAEDVAWMAGLPFHVETPEFRVVHWGLYPGVPLAEVPEDVRAGTTSGETKLRERYGERPWYDFYEDEVPVVFGHAVVGEEPLILRDRIYGIDTGCCHGQRLTALVMPERRIVQVQARADHWKRVMAEWQVPVLTGYPWPEMTFAKIQKKAAALRDPEMGAERTVAEILAWAEAVRAEIPALADRLDGALAALQAEFPDPDAFGAGASAHPAGSWLLRLHRGRLSREHLGCESPRAVFTLAAALGATLSAPERP